MQSFSDMMSGSRGPGLIGTLLAMLVLVGFGSLYFFVFDSELQGGGQSIEATIRNQDSELDNLKQRQASLQKELADKSNSAKGYEEASIQFRSVKAKLEGLKVDGGTLEGGLQSALNQFEEYKDRYRVQVRRGATGLKYDELKTLSGKTYRQVVVKKVDAIGISFQHESGTSRADYEDLTADVQEYFQYDPKQKEMAIRQESIVQDQHLEQVNIAQSQATKQRQEQAVRGNSTLQQKNAAELSALRLLLTQLDSMIQTEQKALDREREHVRRYGGIVNFSQYQVRMGDLRSRRATTESRIAELQKSLDS